MIELKETVKIDLLKFHLGKQIENLRNMTQVDLRILTGYFTLQMALGGWLTSLPDIPPTGTAVRIGMSLIDLTLALLACWLLHNSRLRREEVIQTVLNINTVLGYNEKDAYADDMTINAETKIRLWCPIYLIGIVTAAIGVQLIIFSA